MERHIRLVTDAVMCKLPGAQQVSVGQYPNVNNAVFTAKNVHQTVRITGFVARCGGWLTVTAIRMVSGNRVQHQDHWPGTLPAQSVQGRCMRGCGRVHPSSLSDSVGIRPPLAHARGEAVGIAWQGWDRVGRGGIAWQEIKSPPARRSRRAGRRVL
jgi:hypothetical protein